ncbi:hypothetical protein SAMN05216573_10382 [Bradyrhizobium sp. Rc3b]|uniref:hypothetical protein n=1 Tax=unclassified Bradyrhizobium TaxID=2631580 RepID=UPI0008E6C833|nr:MULTISPECIES: hypothetical protein [unclassified Bradyrhizobium]MBB4377203.1 hypothetical protein [Bradyrhizobium sp. SBR1B]SFM62778.1 hypothetical protein SAMN05216573_10382 [Bradyrhizobium sp. Rc3b]
MGRLDKQMDPFHPAAHLTTADRVPENPELEQVDTTSFVDPAREEATSSPAHFGSGQAATGVTGSTNWIDRGRRIWRRHLQRDQLPRTTGGSMGNFERWLIALLSVGFIVSCVCAIIVFMQVNARKLEIATLQRDIIALKLRVARLDQIASTNEIREKASSGTPKPPSETQPDQAPLILSREEIQLIRDYIKPAPVAGPATETIKVGEPVVGETVPFPSPITEKVRKLLGARFTVRNGVVVIIRSGSRHADAVIGPN